MLRTSEMTDRQIEFRTKLDALISEYAEDIGPSLAGNESGYPGVTNPMCISWVIAAEWDDLDSDGDDAQVGYVVWLDSGTRLTQTIGLVTRVMGMMDLVE